MQSDTDCTVTIEPTTGESGTFTFAPDGGTPVVKTVSLKNSAVTTSLRIFGTGAANRYASFRLYGFKLYRRETTEGDEGPVTADVPQLDLVPCEEKATGFIGLYDLVNKKFLANAGTGAFRAGPRVFVSNTLEVRSRNVEAGTVDTSVNGTYEKGAVVTIRATPAAGKRFFRWAGDIEKVADVLSPETTVTMNGGADLTALFGGEIIVAPTGGDYNNLNDAVAAANDYDTIVVEDGDYTNTTADFLVVKKPIAIVAKNGSGGAHFLGQCAAFTEFTNTNCHGLQIDNAEAVVRGITFRNYGNDGNDKQLMVKAIDLQAGLVENCVVSNSRPHWGANAVRVSGGLLRNTLICRNRNNTNAATVYGGALYLEGSGVASNCVVHSNTSDASNAYGGGVTVNGTHAKLLDSRIFDNTASQRGGGVYLIKGLVENCVISNNAATAGGVYQVGGLLKNCLVQDNRCDNQQKYPGVYSTGGTIEGCEILGNFASYSEGRQLYKTEGVVKDTTAAEGRHVIPCSDVVKIAAGVTVTDCTFQCPTVNGSAELNASDFFANGDHLRASRLVGPAPLTVEFAVVKGGVAGTPWQKTYEACGEYLETAEGFSCTVKVMPTTVYVGKNGTATFPYDTEEKATPDFQLAHDTVYADDEIQGIVEVLPDTYAYTGSDVSKSFRPWMLVNKNVTVRGATGNRDDVVFDAKRKIMAMFFFHPKALLKDLTISNGRLDDTPQYGATMHLLGGHLMNCVISKGYANYGGNASMRGGRATGCLFAEGNLVQSGEDRPGGGLQIWGPARVTNSIFQDNTGGLGGGFSMHDSGAVVSNCVVRNNAGGVCCGGGVGVLAGLVTHCVITNNISSQGAGGARVSGGTLRNCLIANNRADGTGAMGVGSKKSGGGGITVTAGTAENCTVAYNTSASPTRSDELYQTGGTVRNCVFVGKDMTASFDVCKTGGTATYCCFRPGASVVGEGNKSEDALMAAPDKGDYTLLLGSPAIDSGRAIAEVTSDLLGKPRPVNDVYDMGCYEMDFSGKMGVAFDADVKAAGAATEVTLTAMVEGGVKPYTYRWMIGGAVYETDSAVFKHTFGYGEHAVTLVVKDANGAESDPVERSGLIKIRSAVVYVSTTGSGVWPYDTWEKATPDWNAAVGAVYATDEIPGKIWIADGTYTAHDSDVFTVDLTLPIELCGTNPACAVLFNGNGTYHKVVKLNNPKSRLANVTISNCAGKGNSDCGCLWLLDGLATNCVFTGGSAAGAGNVWQTGGTMVDCVIRDHDANPHEGGDRMGGGLYLAGGTAERLVVSGCTDGSAGGVYVDGDTAVLRDSVVCNNITSAGGAIGLVRGLVENCVVTNNTSKGVAGGFGVAAGTGGAGVYQKGGTLRNCLIQDNRCKAVGPSFAALYLTGASAMAYNNTVWANTMGDGVTNDVHVASGTVANTLAYALANEAGTVDSCFVAASDGDPKFRMTGGVSCLPKSSSPCVNGGNNAYWGGVEDAVDLRGCPRVLNNRVDVGCYEVANQGLSVIFR